MNLAYIRNRIRILIDDKNARDNPDAFINTLINEGLRAICKETNILEDNNSSLTYSSTYDGFALPADFIEVKALQWLTSNDYRADIYPNSLEKVYAKRNAYRDIEVASADALNPIFYCIHKGYIILDSTTQTSPILYYYKYDASLSADTSSPTIPSEYHKYLIDYGVAQLKPGMRDANGVSYERRFNYGMRDVNSNKKKVGSIRANYHGY